MKRWGVRACQKDVDDSEWRKLCGITFPVVGPAQGKDLWLKVLGKTFGLDTIRESVDEQRAQAAT